jgi:hypothetical protein
VGRGDALILQRSVRCDRQRDEERKPRCRLTYLCPFVKVYSDYEAIRASGPEKPSQGGKNNLEVLIMLDLEASLNISDSTLIVRLFVVEFVIPPSRILDRDSEVIEYGHLRKITVAGGYHQYDTLANNKSARATSRRMVEDRRSFFTVCDAVYVICLFVDVD